MYTVPDTGHLPSLQMPEQCILHFLDLQQFVHEKLKKQVKDVSHRPCLVGFSCVRVGLLGALLGPQGVTNHRAHSGGEFCTRSPMTPLRVSRNPVRQDPVTQSLLRGSHCP